jgi:omega-hydroxy-beta-dihydromenaquinone-9 sulfotransferase
MFKRLGIAWLTVGRTFGTWVSPIGTFFLLMSLRTLVMTGMAFDSLFVPGLRRSRLQKPIVIVGNPRSGTTFLHRFLVDNNVGAGLRLWEMMWPSLTLRRLIRPLLPRLEALSPARHHSTVAHDTGLTSIETDDASMLFRHFDGFFLYGFIFAFADKDYRKMFEPSGRDTSKRDFAWFERLWRDNSFGHPSHRVVAKLFSVGTRMPRFMESFPDARVLYMVRDPVQVIPSALSLVTGVLDKRFGFWTLPEATRKRYIERLYDAFVLLLRSFHDDWVAGRVPKDRVMLVRFDRLMQDFGGLMNEILTFVGAEKTPELEEEIERVAAEQKKFQSKHKYDANKFGIEEARIRKDCAFVYETFLDGYLQPGETAEHDTGKNGTSAPSAPAPVVEADPEPPRA